MENQKIALITGVSREMGLGFETAKQLARKNIKVIITARDLHKAATLAKKLKSEKLDVMPMAMDVLKTDSILEVADAIDQQFGELDILINNAGGYYDAGVTPLDIDFDYVRDAFEINVLGTWRTIKYFTPLLEKSGHGVVVNVSSSAASFVDPYFGLAAKEDITAYGISKLALNGLTVKIALQVKGKGIKVNAVCPGFTATFPGTEQYGARPVADGAQGIVWAALLPEDGPTGGFFRDGKPLDW